MPDGIIYAYALNETHNVPPGYFQPALYSMSETLARGLETELMSRIQVTSVLLLKCPRTHMVR